MRQLYGTLFLCILLLTSSPLFSQQRSEGTIKNVLRKNIASLKISAADLDGAIITDNYTDQKTNIQYIYLQQTWQHIKVFNRIMTVIIRNDSVLYNSGKFFDRMAVAGTSAPSIQVDLAVIKAASHLQLSVPVRLTTIEDRFAAEKKYILSSAGITKKNIEAELVWRVIADTTIRLAWNVNLDVLGSPDWWNVRVDARNGEILDKDNWTVEEAPPPSIQKINTGIHLPGITSTTPDAKLFKMTGDGINNDFIPPPAVTNAAYYVVPFPYESPKHHALVTEHEPWLKAGVINLATSEGWQYDGTTDFTITRGNNAMAYLDVTNTNLPSAASNWPDTSTTAIPGLNFNFIPDFNLSPENTTNKRTAITNLFYWNNIMHDVFYQYGFTETAGNFQADNQGRGGIGNDYVQAEGQDASGTSNANFSTPVDGQRPRMQMYLWSSTPTLTVTAPPGIAGSYVCLESSFSTANKLADTGPISGQVIYYNDDVAGSTHIACNAPANVLTGKIALIDRVTCNFTVKVKNAQVAGAIAVIMVNNVAGGPIVMGGTDNTVTIPAIMVSQTDGALIAAQLANGVTVTIAGGLGLDGDLDNIVICHEYGHGISTRLTGGSSNSSCLNNAEKGNEGWSDYIGLMMVTNWATATANDGTLQRTIGTYAANQPITGGGIRNFPYSTDIVVNPLVYKAILPSESHDLGEYWCMALWEMTWEMIKMDGINPNLYNATGSGGNVAALKLVVEGMKLQPCNPGFIDARDAILKADTLLYNAHYSCGIWRAFAKRGMGRNALQGSSNSVLDQVPDFTVGTVAITSSPANVSSCAGATAIFSVSATGTSLTFQWQVSSNGGVLFTDISGATSNPLSLNAVDVSMNNNQYRCVVDGSCSSNTVSGAGLLTVSPGPVINTQPQAQTVCAGENVTFSVSATGSILGYQWQVSVDAGANFTNIASATANSITLPSVTAAMNNNQYRCIIGANCGTGLNSSAVKLTVNSSVTISGQPQNKGGCNGESASFSIEGIGITGYQWQLSTDNGASFNNIAGENSSSITLNNITFAMDGNQYRCVLTSACTGTTSNAATLSVFSPPVVSAQPENTIVCAGSDAIFSVTATGPITGYQWQESGDGGASFHDISGATAATLTIHPVIKEQDQDQFRCKVIGNCTNINSTPGILLVNPQPQFTIGSLPSTLCVSDTAIGLSASLDVGTWSGQGITGNQFNPSVAGAGSRTITYTVTNVIGCSLALSATIQVNECPERHIELNSHNSIIIYPNPNSGKFNIRIHTDLYTKLGMKVYASDGKFLKAISFDGLLYDRIVPVDLSRLPNGAYFLYFYNQEGNSLKKKTFGIVINR